MIRGRPPKPIEQKRRLGNPGKRRLPRGGTLAVVPEVDRGLLEHPMHEVLARVLDQGITWLADSDAPALKLFEEQLEEREGLRDAVLAGIGDRRQLRELDKQVIELLSRLGFDPAARSRLGLAEVKAHSKLEELRDRQATKGN